MTSKYAWLARFKEAGQAGLDSVNASSERSRNFSPLSKTLLARRAKQAALAEPSPLLQVALTCEHVSCRMSWAY